MDWIQLPQDMAECETVVSTVMNMLHNCSGVLLLTERLPALQEGLWSRPLIIIIFNK
jgi:hypothetical protein